MPYGITKFNMDDEKDDGHFDAEGNFVWNKEDLKVQEDTWLDDVSEDQINAARHAKSRKAFREELAEESMTEEQANRTLAAILRSRETVLQALQRLGSKKRKLRGKKQRHGKNDATSAAPAEQTEEEKEQFNRVTEAADFLMRMGEVDVYSQMKEEFVPEEELLAQRQQQRQHRDQEDGWASERRVHFEEGKSEENPPPQPAAKATTMWEYKGADGQVHGPFPTASIIAWRQAGYFTGDNAVDMRPVAPQTESKPAEEPEAKPAISAEQELLNDFEDSDSDEEQKKEEPEPQGPTWQRSDAIDFAAYA
ncbi:TPA: LOW QUALITY PROTEIN: hypothetical protein N0F65_012239 [Lagenidium giganteum]|uniref:GYF domain-containing protein n=1 Tax=Lagenidium giganteum TaxID=4803 RepID=A0AAV2ZEL6_9STRA|nr:TPA: LOW QUALITY PROTEIN: hypothetical protein N0F65_012239 [Lagenidium giganteum]